MMRPLYKGAGTPQKNLHSNKGLWFERFFNQYDVACKLKEPTKDEPDVGKLHWIKTVISGRCGNEEALKQACEWQRLLCGQLGGDFKAFKTTWHFATGLGNTHPVENGFLWHPTLGTPYLSGASIKGMVRAWVENWSGLKDSEKREICLLLFGSDNKNPKKQLNDNQAGSLIFFDALPLEPVLLTADIMTPHMKHWYAKGDTLLDLNDPNANDIIPADWHNPIPIPFLVVEKASFLFSIAPRTEAARADLNTIMEILELALSYMGAGAKTATGYGCLEADSDINKAWEKQKQQTRLAALPPCERYRAELKAKTDKQIAEMFGRDFNSTQKEYTDTWEILLEVLFDLKKDVITTWATADKKSAEGKAYHKLKNIRRF
jgi:CRISPR-associated protein Cmr6